MATYDADGNRILTFGEAAHTRNTAAWSRYTGKAHRANSPMVAEDRVYYNTWEPQIFYTHSGETELTYAGYLTRIATWETAYVTGGNWEKITLGNSSGASSSPKPIYGYRLGPLARKHFVITSTIHGNEHDGLNGEIKAIELLTDLAQFKPFRDEWTIFWIPVMNPDAYANDLRNLETVGPNGQTVNLNRNWDWWWGDFVESSLESKGSAPESEPEAQTILNYWRGTGPFAGQGAVEFGFLIDLHANKGPGARYQSRDRVWPRISGAEPIPTIPDSLLEVDFHMQARKAFQGVQTKRIIANPSYPDLFCRSYHSRFNPHMHSYFSSQGVPSMIVEELKVDFAAPGTETYDTACDFRMDYILALAATVTASYWEVEDGVLLEPAATQAIPENPDFKLWSSSEYRPQFWSLTRAFLQRFPEIEGQWESNNNFYDGTEAVKVTSNIVAALEDPAEYTRIGLIGDPTDSASACYQFAVLDPGNDRIQPIDLFSTVDLPSKTLTLHTATHGAALLHGNAQGVIDVLGGGTSVPSTGAVNTIHRVSGLTTGAGASEAAAGDTLNTARMFMGYCDNCLDFPAAASVLGWVFGGYDGGGSRLTSIEEWNPTTETCTTLVGVLPTALADCTAVFCPDDGIVYIFGGTTGAGVSSAIYTFNTNSGVVGTHGTSMAVALKHVGAAYTAGDGLIWLIGGELSSGDMSDKIYTFNPVTGDYDQVDGILIDADIEGDEDEDGETTPWNIEIGRFDMIGVNQGLSDFGEIYFAGGRLNDGSGAIQDNVYYFTPEDQVIGLASTIEYGYLRYGSAFEDTKLAAFYSDTFDASLDTGEWDNPSSAWAWDASQSLYGQASTLGWLISKNTATYNSTQRLVCDVQLSDVDQSPEFRGAIRGTWAAGALTDGYEISYTDDAVNQVWTLKRFVSSSGTTLTTYDATSDASRRLTNTAARTFEMRVEKDGDAVYLQVLFNGLQVLEYWDLHANRITGTGLMGIYGGGG